MQVRVRALALQLLILSVGGRAFCGAITRYNHGRMSLLPVIYGSLPLSLSLFLSHTHINKHALCDFKAPSDGLFLSPNSNTVTGNCLRGACVYPGSASGDYITVWQHYCMWTNWLTELTKRFFPFYTTTKLLSTFQASRVHLEVVCVCSYLITVQRVLGGPWGNRDSVRLAAGISLTVQLLSIPADRQQLQSGQ